MRRVLIEKNIREGGCSVVPEERTYEGWEDIKPSVGEPYCIYCEDGGMLRTSDVVEVNDGFIKTRNSLYRLTILEEEPFELTGESYPDVTHKLFFKKAGIEKRE
jgi:hypothetical protein